MYGLNPVPNMATTTGKTPSACPKCGRELSAHAPKGLCPACLMKFAMDTQCGAADENAETPTPSINEITQLFPQLEILELLGKGGMGVVYKARQRQLDRFVALKILSPHLSNDPAFAERFAREAKALAQLNHPNIVSIYDFGQTGSCFYFIMEFVDGMSLWDLEQRKRPLSPEEAFAIVPKICEALQYAHDEGVIHRDIKPGNILIDKKGRVKIADFGLAKILGKAEDLTLTQSRMAMGTVHYMAPEQTERPLEVDHRADIYSLGVVFYEMLTGELPIGRFDAPSQKVQLDVRLDGVVLRALEKEPARRYQQVSEIKQTVDGISATPPSVSASPSESTGEQRTFSSSLMWSILFAVIAIIALCATFVVYHINSRPPAHPPALTQHRPAKFQTSPDARAETITLDNSAAILQGSWITSTIAPDKYGADYIYSPCPEGDFTATATYFPNVKVPAEYHVEVWHSVGQNRSPRVWWLVVSGGETNMVAVNQTIHGGRWTRIATTHFTGETNDFVQLLNNGAPALPPYHSMAIADAVRFVPVQ